MVLWACQVTSFKVNSLFLCAPAPPWARASRRAEHAEPPVGPLFLYPLAEKVCDRPLSLYPLADFSPRRTWRPLFIYPLAKKVCDRPLSLYPLADFSPRLTWGPLSPYLFPISMLSSTPFRTNRANSSPFWPLAMYPGGTWGSRKSPGGVSWGVVPKKVLPYD